MPVLTRERRQEIIDDLPTVGEEFAEEYGSALDSETVTEDEDIDAALELSENMTHKQVLEALDKLPTVVYPEEVLRRWDREYEEAKAQMASGELKPMTVAEYAAKKGIKLG